MKLIETALLLSALGCCAIAQLAPTTYTPDARRVAKSTAIVRGRLSVDAKLVQQAIDKGGAYVDFGIKVAALLKDDSSEEKQRPRSVRIFVKNAEDGLPRDLNKDRVICLRRGRAGEHWLALGVAESILPDSRQAVTILSTIVADHVKRASRSPVSTDDEMDRRVGALIDKFVSDPKAQRVAMVKLERLGRAAVGSIIKRLDDPRALAEPTVSFTNDAKNRFERHRVYGAKTVMQALCALLSQITGESFALGYSSPANAAERAFVLRGWRLYASYLPAPARNG